MRLPAARRRHQPLDRRVERDHAAAVLEIAAQRQHVAVAVDDAGLRRAHGDEAGELRLQPPGRRAVDEVDALDAVDLRLLEDAFEPRDLALVGGDDELAAFAVRHAVRGAKVVQHPPPARAVIGALRAGRIIEPGVDHLAVARGRAGADGVGGLRDDHLMPGQRRRARDGEADDAGADDEDLHFSTCELPLDTNVISKIRMSQAISGHALRSKWSARSEADYEMSTGIAFRSIRNAAIPAGSFSSLRLVCRRAKIKDPNGAKYCSL